VPQTARLFLIVLGSVAAFLSLFGCQLEDRVDLLRIVRVHPQSASAGERITILGEGLPEGRGATVTFQGEVFRPGLPPERDVRFTAKAKPGPRNSVVFAFDGNLERRFSGGSTLAGHATLRGDLRVVFEPAARGVASIAGTYRGLVLEVLPSVLDPEVTAQRMVAGSETLASLGAATTAENTGNGLRLSALDADGRFYRAGLRAGDRLVEFGGVTVVTQADLRPLPGERTGRAVVERDGRLLPPFSVDLSGVAPPGAHALVFAGAGVLFLIALLAFLASPLSRVMGLFYRLAALRRTPSARLGARTAAPRRSFVRLEPSADAGPTSGVAAAVVLAIIAVGFASHALGRPILTREVDLIVSVPAVSLALLFARFFDGGFVRGRRWSFGSAVVIAWRTFACLLPALISVAGVVFSTGRFVIEEIVADQGGVPWRWAAARNPGMMVLLVVFLAMTVPESAYRGVLPAEGLEPSSLPRSTSRALVRLAEWTHLFLTCGLACALFLGGWRVPTVAYMAQESSRRLEILGAVLFFAKFATLVGFVLVVRQVFSRVFLEDVSGVFGRWAAVASVVGSCLAVGWAAGFEGSRSQVPAEALGYAVTALGATFLALTALVLIRKASPRPSVSTVNPWL
jgi:NADH:ubiquinone oxidoreductase subunit H